MVGVLILLFIIVPIIELAFFIQIAQWIGPVPALALVLLLSAAGAWLVKREGLSAFRRGQGQLNQGIVPAAEIVNGGLILFAGALMLTPGFATDILGILLLLPPTRALVRVVLLRRFETRIREALDVPTAVFGSPLGGSMPGNFGGVRVRTGRASYRGVYDVHEVNDDAPGPTRSGEQGASDTPPERPELGRY